MDNQVEVTEELKTKLVEHAPELIELLNHLTILAPQGGGMCAPTFSNGLGMRAKRMLHALGQPQPDNLGNVQTGTGFTVEFMESGESPIRDFLNQWQQQINEARLPEVHHPTKLEDFFRERAAKKCE
jgi:hypothetical protein